MKKEEKLVNQYLTSQGFTNVVYEPDGNIPPDFVINSSIAVEVRRLNQHFERNGEKKPLEELDYKIYSTFDKIIKNFAIDEYSHSAFLGIRFKRPLTVNKNLRNKISEVLTSHLPHLDEKRTYDISDNLQLRIIPAEGKLESIYRFGTFSDSDSGGFVVNLIYENIKHIIEEKERKIAPYKDKYEDWWLALVDTIGYGLDQHDLQQFFELPKLDTFFKKILLISPLMPEIGVNLINHRP